MMDQAIPDAVVSGFEHLISAITLPDADDRHVVAAAIHGRADAIITFNLKDFPPETLSAYGLEAIHPDEFISLQNDLDDAALIVAAQRCRARLKNPPKTQDDYLNTLRQQGLPKTVAILGPFRTVI